MEKCRPRLTKCANRAKCEGQGVDPVCGTDARTYPNQCQLGIASCLRGVQLAHVGNCSYGLHLKVAQTGSECPKECPIMIDPVCGSDGNVYKSLCHLEKDTCGQSVVEVAPHHCRTTANCKKSCPKEKNFVCGSDNKFYSSECEMKRSNCGKHIYVVPMKRCLSGFVFKGCQKMCPTYYDPVCGTDEKTYSNSCFLEIENCRSRSVVTLKHLGTCADPVRQPPKNYLY